MNYEPLSPKEYEFMEIIWAHPEGISSHDICENFPQAQGTKATILFRIRKKGYATMRQVVKQTIYTPLMSKEEYRRIISEQNLKRKLGISSLEGLVASLCGKKELSAKQADKLNNFIEELMKDDEQLYSINFYHYYIWQYSLYAFTIN